MNIVYIVSGSGGGFYCQNCIRDVGWAACLRRAGHDVMLVPLYLPLAVDAAEPALRAAPVFYGAINVYLAQKCGLFRRLPERLRRRFDAPALLRWAARRAGSTRPRGMGAMTLSVLQGRDGRQRRELAQLTGWLKTLPRRPDVVHFSNALLLGLAPAVRDALGAPVICSLQDEDAWLDALSPRYRERCWAQIKMLGGGIDCFVPVSSVYADAMTRRLGIPAAKCRVVPPGVDVAEFAPPPAPPDAPVIGFLAEPSPDHGLDILVEAFIRLRRTPELTGLRLRATGGDLRVDTPYIAKLRREISAAGLAGAVDWVDAFQAPRRAGFLRSLSVLTVPARRPEALGLFMLEAMACGVPVCQPNLGGYPEVVAATGGGVIYDDLSPAGLAAALRPLLLDRSLAGGYGRAGRAAVASKYSREHVARQMAGVYRGVMQV